MEPIDDLLRLRRAFTSGLRIQTAAVSADELDGGTIPQPPGCTIDTPVIEKVSNGATLEINHDGPVSCCSSPAPVVDANHSSEAQ
ncbi:hypothetical protein GGD56_000515 [Rhizobium mongolense]|uniref:Uncharacterized protein n=1 Tax=Rhizobium mongolense TaxID=57676 RepID=A0ABR6IFQ4_9HYPH|nr:hypothetical protein [Rhizobium mongolense]